MLKKIKMLTKISNAEIIGYSVLSIILGITGFTFIMLVNSKIELLVSTESRGIEGFSLLSFLGIIALFFIIRRILSAGIINLSQEIYWNVRKVIINQILKAPLRKIQDNKDQIYSTLTNDVGNITRGSLLIIDFVSSILLIICCFIYMAYISLTLFSISLSAISITVAFYSYRSKNSHEKFNISRNLEGNFIGLFNSLLSGAKEINLNPIIGKKINRKLGKVIQKAKFNDKSAFIGYLDTQLTGQVLFYLLITFIIFYFLTATKVPIGSSLSYIIVLMYLLGPVGMVMMAFPILNKTIISMHRLFSLLDELEGAYLEMGNDNDLKVPMRFDVLEYEGYSFSYGPNRFSVGPINLKINKGEVVFICGGNGSGKTTLLNLLLDIYEPDQGKVTLNGEILGLENMLIMKELFSPIFSDFYLFDEMYGVDKIDINRATEFLRIFEIDKKVVIENNRFSTLDLSAGLRKRLALINALFENKPIIALDEWAADQDPIFRHKFYKEIIPYIVAKGFTVVAITHDDKYFDCADRLFKMEYGQLVEVKEKVSFELKI